jgi:hypothetical protein
MLRIPHCLDNRLTDGGNVVSPTHWPHSTPQEHFSASGSHFYQRLIKHHSTLTTRLQRQRLIIFKITWQNNFESNIKIIEIVNILDTK